MNFRKGKLIGYSIFLLALFLSGCGTAKNTATMKGNPAKNVRLIAVLPVLNETSDQQAAAMLRSKVLDALYFKGYPRIPLRSVDEGLNTAQQKENTPGDKVQYSRELGEQMKIDAVLYCDLKESRTVYHLLYSPLSVAAEFELRSARTGQLLWKNSYSTVKRNYGISKHSLRLKTSLDYEPAIQELVDKAMESLPENPDILG